MPTLPLAEQNAREIFDLPVSQAKQYLPEIFRRIRKATEQPGTWVQNYVAWLRQKHLKYYMSCFGLPTGWDAFGQACVETDMIESFMELALQTDREGCWIAIFNSLDAMCYLITVSTIPQRRIIFERCVKCNALDTLTKMIKGHRLNLHKYIAMRVLRALASDLFLPEILPADKAAELVEFLITWTRDDKSRWLQQVRTPAESWQVGVMTNRLLVPNYVSEAYGARWYGMTQEFAMFAAYGALSRYPLHSRKYYLDVLKLSPGIIDALFDVAALPRPAAYPECQIDQLASETLALFCEFPRKIIPGADVPVPEDIKPELDSEYQSTMEALKILTRRPNWVQRILAVFTRLDGETYADINRKLSLVATDYYGVQPDENTTKMIFESRGHSRGSMLRLISAVTYLDDISDGELLSFLRVAYLASQSSLKKTWENFVPRNLRETCEHSERTTDAYRKVIWSNANDHPSDPACIVPEQAITGPIALLRLLTVLARRGILEEVPKWTTLPAGTAPGTDLRQVQQITSPEVIQKLLPLVVRRTTISREKVREWVTISKPGKRPPGARALPAARRARGVTACVQRSV